MHALVKTVKQELLFLERLAVHTGFREAYFFAKNSWGMFVHPWLTTARVWGRRHYAQMFLVFGFPFNLWLLIFFLVGMSIWLGRPGPVWRDRLLVFLVAVTGLLACLAVYYVFWLWRYRQLRRRQELVGKKA